MKVLFAIILLFPQLLIACTCDIIPTFIEDIDKESLIFKVEILKHKTLPINKIREFYTEEGIGKTDKITTKNLPNIPLIPYSYTSYTILKVIDEINGKAKTDTIIFFNGYDAMCLGSLYDIELGTKFILKLNKSRKEVFNSELQKDLKKKRLIDIDLDKMGVYTNHICHQWKLKIQDNMVVGNISKNLKGELVRELQKGLNISREEEEKILKKLEKYRGRELEKMNYLTFVKLIEKTLNKDEN